MAGFPGEETGGMGWDANRRKYGYEKQKADALMDKWGKKQVGYEGYMTFVIEKI